MMVIMTVSPLWRVLNLWGGSYLSGRPCMHKRGGWRPTVDVWSRVDSKGWNYPALVVEAPISSCISGTPCLSSLPNAQNLTYGDSRKESRTLRLLLVFLLIAADVGAVLARVDRCSLDSPRGDDVQTATVNLKRDSGYEAFAVQVNSDGERFMETVVQKKVFGVPTTAKAKC